MKKKLNYKQQQFLREKKIHITISIIASIFFIGITAIHPLYIANSRYFNITFQKAAFFWVLTAAVTLSLFFMLFFVKKAFYIKNYYIENEPRRLLTLAEWALISFILLSFISALLTFWNGDLVTEIFFEDAPYVRDVVWIGYRYDGFISFLCYGLTFFIVARFYKPNRFHLLALSVSIILVSLYGILQFMGIDIFGLFPFEIFIDSSGNMIYGGLSAYFRTTLGNTNIVAAYCTFAVILSAALFSTSRLHFKWNFLYVTASAISFALFLIADGDASKFAILCAMILLIPYWISDRARLGRLLIVLSTWCAVYAGHNAYVSKLKEQLEFDPSAFAPNDQYFLRSFTPRNPLLFFAAAAVLLVIGLCLLFLVKRWAERPIRIAGIVFLPLSLFGGLLFIEIMGARWSDQPGNIVWQAREILHGRFGDNFGSNRMWIWKSALSVVFNHPLFGTGPDTFLYALGDELQMEAYNLHGEIYDKAHNTFLQIAVCMGLPALLSYLVFLGNLFISAIKRAFKQPLLLAFGAAALCYTIQSFFCVEVPMTTPLFWVALGIMAREVWAGKIGMKEFEF